MSREPQLGLPSRDVAARFIHKTFSSAADDQSAGSQSSYMNIY